MVLRQAGPAPAGAFGCWNIHDLREAARRFLPRGLFEFIDRGAEDELKRRIEEAAKFADLDQLALSPQCGFSSGIGGNTMDIEHEKAKLRLVVEVAAEVWG